jgi:hypothetical protein
LPYGLSPKRASLSAPTPERRRVETSRSFGACLSGAGRRPGRLVAPLPSAAVDKERARVRPAPCSVRRPSCCRRRRCPERRNRLELRYRTLRALPFRTWLSPGRRAGSRSESGLPGRPWPRGLLY